MYTVRSCWLCGRNGARDPLDKHHIFGGSNRRKSEEYGLTVYLCHHDCHLFGDRAAHNCRETMDALHRYGQKLVMRQQGWTTEDFIREFGRNYLDETETACAEKTPDGKATYEKRQRQGASTGRGSFRVTDMEICVNW